MKLIIAIIRPDRLSDVEAALGRAGVIGLTVSPASGRGAEREPAPGTRAGLACPGHPEAVRIEVACAEGLVEAAIRAILDAARTGGAEDGRILVQPLEQVIRIGTGERDVDALAPLTADAVQRAARSAYASEYAAAELDA